MKSVGCATVTVVEPTLFATRFVGTLLSPALNVTGDVVIAPTSGAELVMLTVVEYPPRMGWISATFSDESKRAEETVSAVVTP